MGNYMGKALDESFNKNKKFMIEMQGIQVSLQYIIFYVHRLCLQCFMLLLLGINFCTVSIVYFYMYIMGEVSICFLKVCLK